MWDNLNKRIQELKNSGTYDLSSEEDLSIAIMNLISLEEHFFFTAKKTGKDDYLDLLQETREIRKKLLAKMIDQHEGETWCISKHLLASTVRMMEVGTKYLNDGKKQEAKEMFDMAYKTYSLFWALRLKLLNLKNVKAKELPKNMSVDDLVSRLVDCCKE